MENPVFQSNISKILFEVKWIGDHIKAICVHTDSYNVIGNSLESETTVATLMGETTCGP